VQPRQIILDCDGVIANLIQACIDACKVDVQYVDVKRYDCWVDWGMTVEQFWEACSGESFWLGIEPYPYATEFVSRLRDMFPVTVCTTLNGDPACASGKLKWLEKHFGITYKDVAFCKNKYLMGHPLRILIDDFAPNIIDFAKHDGMPIGYKQPWNRFTDTWEDILEQLAPLSLR